MIYLNTETARPNDCAFRYFSEGEHHITRRFSQSVLLLGLEGTLYFEEEGKPVSITPGKWYIQRAGLFQTGNRASLSPVYFYLHFDGEFFESEISPLSALPLTGTFEIPSVRPLLEKLVHCQKEASSQRLFEVSLFRSLLYFLYCSDQEEQNTLPYRILTAVSSHMEQPVSLGALSEELGYCEDYLGRVFRRHYGVSLYRYANRLRVQRAKQLLRETDKSVEQIGRETGCLSVSRFYRMFRRETGMSPSAWRTETGKPENPLEKEKGRETKC